MPKKAGKLTLEESKMTATLTLNDMTIEQAGAVLSLLNEMQNAECCANKADSAAHADGVPLFEDDMPSAAEDLAAETAEVSADEPAYTIEQVRAAFTKYAKTNGREAAKKLLEKFGAGKVTELKKTDYAAVMKEVS